MAVTSVTETERVGEAPKILHLLPQKLMNDCGDIIPTCRIGWLTETPADTPIEEMRRLYQEEGYVLIKGLLPREDVLDVREDYFSQLACTGILKPGTLPREGIFNPALSPDAVAGIGSSDMNNDSIETSLIIKSHTSPLYLKFLEHPVMRDMVRKLTGWNREILLKRNLLRHSVPGGNTTGIHYDKLFLRKGEAEFLTAWVPLGDVSAEGGGLIYLEQTSKLGKDFEAWHTKNNANLPLEEQISAYNENMMKLNKAKLPRDALAYQLEHAPDKRWLVGNFAAGDIIFHNPWIVHCASKNTTQDGSMRLSSDIRFAEDGSDFDTRWMRQYWHPEDRL